MLKTVLSFLTKNFTQPTGIFSQEIAPKCYFNLNFNSINYIWHIIITFQYLFKGEWNNSNGHWSVHFHSWNQPLRTKPDQGLEIEWTPLLKGSFFERIELGNPRWLSYAIIDLKLVEWKCQNSRILTFSLAPFLGSFFILERIDLFGICNN